MATYATVATQLTAVLLATSVTTRLSPGINQLWQGGPGIITGTDNQ